MTMPTTQFAGVSVEAPLTPAFEEILTPQAVAFLVELHHRFDARRRELLEKRVVRQ